MCNACGSTPWSSICFVLSIQKHTGLSTAALESAVNSLALAALSRETTCRLGAHTANPRVAGLIFALKGRAAANFNSAR